MGLRGEKPSFGGSSSAISYLPLVRPGIEEQTGKVPAEFHRFLLEAFELRHKGDYGLRHAIAYDQAQEQIARARGFLELAEKLIGPLLVNKGRS